MALGCGDAARTASSATMSGMRARRWADLAGKALLLALLLSAVIWPDLSGVKEKAGTARLVIYPLGGLAVPLWWWVYGRRRARRERPTTPASFPWLADLLVTLPWFLDLLGNRLGLFDSIQWWDDMMHFLNWLLLTAGVLLAWAPRRAASRGLMVMVGLGFGTTAAVAWELGEYATFVRHSAELSTAYTDTLGDLALGSLGALLAGLIIGQIVHGQRDSDLPPTR